MCNSTCRRSSSLRSSGCWAAGQLRLHAPLHLLECFFSQAQRHLNEVGLALRACGWRTLCNVLDQLVEMGARGSRRVSREWRLPESRRQPAARSREGEWCPVLPRGRSRGTPAAGSRPRSAGRRGPPAGAGADSSAMRQWRSSFSRASGDPAVGRSNKTGAPASAKAGGSSRRVDRRRRPPARCSHRRLDGLLVHSQALRQHCDIGRAGDGVADRADEREDAGRHGGLLARVAEIGPGDGRVNRKLDERLGLLDQRFPTAAGRRGSHHPGRGRPAGWQREPRLGCQAPRPRPTPHA